MNHTTTPEPCAVSLPGSEIISIGAEVLHLYAQPLWHAEAYISGGRGALLALRAAIDAALHKGSGECDAFTSDGEGYRLHVVCLPDKEAEKQVVPYTDDFARQPWIDAFGPWTALSVQKGAADMPDCLTPSTAT